MTSRHSKVTALKGFTDTLRGRSGPDYSTAKVQVPARGEEYEWRDYVRGKDLARHLKDKQDILDELTKPQAAGRDQSDQISDLVIKLVHEKLLIPADRKFKKPKPGKKKLVKWPRTLKPVPGAAWDEELFYAFSYDKPTGPMFYLLAVVVALCVLAVPLFPLAPYPVRLAVLYALSGLLSVLLGTMLLRYVVWTAVWLVSGAHFWLLPNMMSDDVPITQLFWPLISFTPHSREDKLSSFLVRGGITLLLGAAGYGLYVASPDAATVKAGVQDAKDSVLAYFDLMGQMKTGITNGTNTTGIELNRTASASNTQRQPSQQQHDGYHAAAAEGNDEHTAEQEDQELPEDDSTGIDPGTGGWDPTLETDAEV